MANHDEREVYEPSEMRCPECDALLASIDEEGDETVYPECACARRMTAEGAAFDAWRDEEAAQ